MDFSSVFGDEIGHVFLRTGIIYVIALIAVRLMGSRTLGELGPFDYVVIVGIGDILATVALDTEEKIWTGAEALLMLLVLERLLSWASMKSTRFRRLIEGERILLIKNGRIIREHFEKVHFNDDDLIQELHKQGLDIGNVHNVKEAWLEACGSVAVINFDRHEPATKEDIKSMIKEQTCNRYRRRTRKKQVSHARTRSSSGEER